MLCPDCNGKPFSSIKKEEPFKHSSSRVCNFCNGKKELDWVEYIFGVTTPGVDKGKLWIPPAGFKKGELSEFIGRSKRNS